jgi:hypothetical protein
MADRDELQPGATQPDATQPDAVEIRDDQIRGRLGGVASGIEVGELEMARANVERVVGRRRTRRRLAGALASAAVVIGAATAVVVTVGDDEPIRLATTDDTLPAEPDTAPDDSVDSPLPTLALPIVDGRAVEVIDGAATTVSVAGASGAPEYGEWIVPWEDGFLVGSMSFPPQPLPEALPEEIAALFPQEVRDLFGGDLPDTIAEATERLSEAGLLDEVSEIIQNNPEASEAVYGVPAGEPTLDVRFTVDGTTWEPREVVLPPGVTYVSTMTAVGDRLVAVYSVFDPLTGAPLDGTITVAATTDLTNWTVQEMVVPTPDGLPEGITASVFAQGLVANDNGWVVSVYSSIDADPYTLLPADFRSEIDAGNGFGMSTDDIGMTVEYDFGPDGSDPAGTRTFTWDELGVSPDVARLFANQSHAPTLWAASWDGQPAPTDAPQAGGQIVPTAAGFVQWSDQTWFSPDGVTWTPSPLPDDVAWVSGAFNVDGGLILLSSTDAGETLVHRVDHRGENAVLLDVPLPDASSLSPNGPFGGSVTSGVVVSVEAPIAPEQQLSVEFDGFRLTVLQPAFVFEVIDLATGEVVVSERPLGGPNEADSNVVYDEAGVTVTDPATGEVLIVFPPDVMEAAERAYYERRPGEYNPDFWLLASTDGQRFLVDDIEDATNGPTTVATNGSRLLLQSGNTWTVYDLA